MESIQYFHSFELKPMNEYFINYEQLVIIDVRK